MNILKIIVSVIKGLRPTITILAGLLVHVGFSISHQSTDWSLVVLVFCIASNTMFTNDYYDRAHDYKKGKSFATLHTQTLQIIVIMGWLYIIVSTGYLFFTRPLLQMLIILWCVGVGIGYSWTRRIPLLPLLLVAVTSSAPLLIGYVTVPSTPGIILFFSVFLIIAGREIIKDIEDHEVDVGYKNTLLTHGTCNENEARLRAGVLIFVGSTLGLFILKWSNELAFPYALYLSGWALCVGSFFLLVFLNNLPGGKRTLDWGIALMVFALVFTQ